MDIYKFYCNLQGTLKIEQFEDHIMVDCGPQYQLVSCADNSWHLNIDTCDGELTAEFHHTPAGFPLWYGREEPSALTRHSITYGYNWAGPVTGKFNYKDKEVNFKGFAFRELYMEETPEESDSKFDAL